MSNKKKRPVTPYERLLETGRDFAGSLWRRRSVSSEVLAEWDVTGSMVVVYESLRTANLLGYDVMLQRDGERIVARAVKRVCVPNEFVPDYLRFGTKV